jgi:hypothetical protein
MRARNFLQHKWHAITIILTVIAIACAALVILRGMPPHRLIMATGLEGGSYYEVGQRYRAALARESVQVELRLTSGSAENLALVLDPDSGFYREIAGVGLVFPRADRSIAVEYPGYPVITLRPIVGLEFVLEAVAA